MYLSIIISTTVRATDTVAVKKLVNLDISSDSKHTKKCWAKPIIGIVSVGVR